MTVFAIYSNAYRLGYDEGCSSPDSGSGSVVNKQALGGFLSSVEKRAFRIARIATGDAEEALDIVQDTMFKLVEKYAEKPPEEWPALFHSILQSRIRDWYRRARVRRAVMGFLSKDDESGVDPIQEAGDGAGRSPDYQLHMDDTVDELDRALNALPLRQQQAFLLRVWEGLDVRSTATAMGCSEGSVKTHYSRAVHTLRDKLGEYWQGDSGGQL